MYTSKDSQEVNKPAVLTIIVIIAIGLGATLYFAYETNPGGKVSISITSPKTPITDSLTFGVYHNDMLMYTSFFVLFKSTCNGCFCY